jgi:hypothetical protein
MGEAMTPIIRGSCRLIEFGKGGKKDRDLGYSDAEDDA